MTQPKGYKKAKDGTDEARY